MDAVVEVTVVWMETGVVNAFGAGVVGVTVRIGSFSNFDWTGGTTAGDAVGTGWAGESLSEGTGCDETEGDGRITGELLTTGRATGGDWPGDTGALDATGEIKEVFDWEKVRWREERLIGRAVKSTISSSNRFLLIERELEIRKINNLHLQHCCTAHHTM